MESIAGTMAEKGDEYVARWPRLIAHKHDLSPEYIADAMERAGVITDDETRKRLSGEFLRREPAPEVAALTPETARRVISELQAIGREIREAAKTTCPCCGLDLLQNGECAQCGEPLA